MKKPKKHHPRSSEKLLEIIHSSKLKENINFEDILKLLGERAFGIALLFFSLPSALPFSAIPGVAFVFSLPILIFSFQMIIGRNTLWLPRIIAKRSIPNQTVIKVISKTLPYLIKIAFFLKPRWAFMTSRFMEVINGMAIFCLAILLILPVPFSNFIFGLLLIIFSLGLIEKDGLFLGLGYLLAMIYLGFIYFFVKAAIKHLIG